MALTCTHSNHYKYQLGVAALNLLTNTIRVLLMRSGFVFDKDIHAKLINIKGTTSARTDISFEDSTKHIHTVAGTFETYGFVAGGKITVSGSTSNNTTFTIVSVDSETQMTIDEAPTTENAGQSITIVGADELADGYGYAHQDLTGQALEESDSFNWAELTAANVIWTATGGSIGPTPGAILYSETSADDTIIGYIDFGEAQTAPNGAQFTISNEKIRIA